jgi:hypothetical protein
MSSANVPQTRGTCPVDKSWSTGTEFISRRKLPPETEIQAAASPFIIERPLGWKRSFHHFYNGSQARDLTDIPF